MSLIIVKELTEGKYELFDSSANLKKWFDKSRNFKNDLNIFPSIKYGKNEILSENIEEINYKSRIDTLCISHFKGESDSSQFWSGYSWLMISFGTYNLVNNLTGEVLMSPPQGSKFSVVI